MCLMNLEHDYDDFIGPGLNERCIEQRTVLERKNSLQFISNAGQVALSTSEHHCWVLLGL